MLKVKELEKENKELQESVDQIYDDYQDVGKEMFKYSEQVEQLETKEQKLIEKLEEYTNNTKKQKLPNFKTVTELIKYKGYAEGKIEACEEILSMIKGEKKW